jgi:hypothetical protein
MDRTAYKDSWGGTDRMLIVRSQKVPEGAAI